MALHISSFEQHKLENIQVQFELDDEQIFNEDLFALAVSKSYNLDDPPQEFRGESNLLDVVDVLYSVTQLVEKQDNDDVSIPEPTPISDNNYIEIC